MPRCGAGLLESCDGSGGEEEGIRVMPLQRGYKVCVM